MTAVAGTRRAPRWRPEDYGLALGQRWRRRRRHHFVWEIRQFYRRDRTALLVNDQGEHIEVPFRKLASSWLRVG